MSQLSKPSDSEQPPVRPTHDWPRLVTEIASSPGARRHLRDLALIASIAAVLIAALAATVLIVHPEIVTMFA